MRDGLLVRGLGGDAVKFLVQMRPRRTFTHPEPDLEAEALDVVRTVVADCRAAGIPSVVENLVYAQPGEELTPREREDLIVESAILLDALQPDLLKLEYPGSAAGAPPPRDDAGTARPEAAPPIVPLPQALAALEQRTIQAALAATGGNKLAASRLLGISRATLYEKLALLEPRS